MIPEITSSIRYVTDAEGNKTDVLIPLASWKALIITWQKLIEEIEDQEDSEAFKDWLRQRHAGEIDSMSLEEFEKELVADGLLPG